jgi:hypothetical protein
MLLVQFWLECHVGPELKFLHFFSQTQATQGVKVLQKGRQCLPSTGMLDMSVIRLYTRLI